MEFDANGNRLTGGGRTNTWVSSMQVRELLNGTVKATYLVGPRGPEYRRDDQAGTIRWYVYDGLGSVVGEVAPDGTLTRSQSFDVYGCVRTSSGAATTKHKFVGSLGHPSDDETGLIYMRARHYDPVCGRFVSEDPGRSGSNWYEYARSNPVNSVDTDGRVSTIATIALVIIAFVLGKIGTKALDEFLAGVFNNFKAIRALGEKVGRMLGLYGKSGQGLIEAGVAEAGTDEMVDDPSEVGVAQGEIEALGGASEEIGASVGKEIWDVMMELRIDELEGRW